MTGDTHFDFGWGAPPLRLGESGPAETERGGHPDDWDPREEDTPARSDAPGTVRRPGGGTPGGPRGPETDGVTTTTD